MYSNISFITKLNQVLYCFRLNWQEKYKHITVLSALLVHQIYSKLYIDLKLHVFASELLSAGQTRTI